MQSLTLSSLKRTPEESQGLERAATDTSHPTAQPSKGTISLDSAALLGGSKVIEILHNGFVYKLQATRLGKLILTK